MESNIRKVYVAGSLNVYASEYDGKPTISILLPVWNKQLGAYETMRISASGIRVIKDKQAVYTY